MANSNNWGEIYKSTWWGDKAWSANTLFIDSAPPGFGLNLLKASEDMNITRDWSQFLISVAANSTDEAAPDGTDTAEKLTFTDAPQSRIQQQIALEANTTYTFSVYAKVRTGTKAFRLRNVTLGQAQQFTADTSWGLNPDDGRYSFSFTTGATAITHTLSIQNAAAAGTGEVFFWGAMLNEGATAGDYVKTETSVGGSAPAPAYSGFGDSFGGVTAYYSLRKFTEAETLNAIRVRRSSDDTEQDIGFDSNGDLDTTALLAFVNESGNAYTSDFTSTEDLFEANGTGAAAQSVGGVDDAYKFTLSGGSNSHFSGLANFIDTGANVSVSFDYYIPSTNSKVDTIGLYSCTPTLSETQIDQWASVSNFETTLNSDDFYFFARKGTDPVSTLDADGDVFYLKNIVVTQTTADGAVTTFYDQSGNGNNATNATASEQPLVVSGGSVLVDGNGKAKIQATAATQYLTATRINPNPFYAFYALEKGTSTGAFSGFSGQWTDSWAIFFGSTRASVFDTSGTRHNVARGTTMTSGNRYLISAVFDNDIEIYQDGTLEGSVSAVGDLRFSSTSQKLKLFAYSTNNSDPNSCLQEVIFFNSDQSTNRTGIETNINDHFSIYP